VRLSPQFCRVAATRQSVTGPPCVAGRIVLPDALIRMKRALLWADCVVNPAGWWLRLSNVVGGCLTATHASNDQNIAVLHFGFCVPFSTTLHFSPRSRETRTNTGTCVIASDAVPEYKTLQVLRSLAVFLGTG
jgi:hypothetical protein